MSIAENLEAIRARVDAACLSAGRAPSEVRLLAVSKTKPLAQLREAYEAGQRLFGENYAQELRDKARELEGVEWHFIGHLQRNKVKYVAGVATLVHAVDSLRLGEALASRSPGQGVLVEVNVGEEASKSGVLPGQVLELCQRLSALDLRVAGLMTIPPAEGAPAPHFATMAELASEGRRQGLDLRELSMGMSSDFEVAIAHGATLVRVGTAIFGARTL